MTRIEKFTRLMIVDFDRLPSETSSTRERLSVFFFFFYDRSVTLFALLALDIIGPGPGLVM